METKTGMCTAKTRAGIDCGNYAMKDHPCCRIHRVLGEIETKLPMELSDLAGSYLGAAELQSRAGEHALLGQLNVRAEGKCAKKYNQCKAAHRAPASHTKFQNECAERCRLQCAAMLQTVLQRPEMGAGKKQARLQFNQFAPTSPLPSLGVQSVSLELFRQSPATWEGTLYLETIPTNRLRPAILFPEWTVGAVDSDETEVYILQDDAKLFPAICSFVLTHANNLHIAYIGPKPVGSETVQAAVDVANVFRTILADPQLAVSADYDEEEQDVERTISTLSQAGIHPLPVA